MMLFVSATPSSAALLSVLKMCRATCVACDLESREMMQLFECPPKDASGIRLAEYGCSGVEGEQRSCVKKYG